jgi:hypothetical protein
VKKDTQRAEEGPMQEIQETGGQSGSVDEHEGTTITSEEEFERWLIAALEWERQRLQSFEASGSQSRYGQQ